MLTVSRKNTVIAGLLVAMLVLVTLSAGCGSSEATGHAEDTHGAGYTDDHAGHDHAEEAESPDPHAGHDHAEEAEASDPHTGHDHAGEEQAAGPVLTGRDLMDAGIRLSAAGPGNVESHVRLLGEVRVNAEGLAHMVPPVAGTIRDVRVREGDNVRAGQILAVIASRELAEARAAYLGALGRRAATLEGVGDWRDAADDLQLDALTSAGLLGRATSISPMLPELMRLEYLGHATRRGAKLNMVDFVKPCPRGLWKSRLCW